MANIFTRHPNDVGMTYLQHFRFALSLAGKTFLCCIASVVHAVFPFLFTTYTSRKIAGMNKVFVERVYKLNKV